VDDLYSGFRCWLDAAGEGWTKISKDRLSKEVSRMIARGRLSLAKERTSQARIYRKGCEPYGNNFREALEAYRKQVRQEKIGPP
jgi:phage tail tape-measure protein